MIILISAVSENMVIGKNGEIPWYLPDDFKHFAQKTKGHTVIMGRKTYDSIIKRLGHPLPQRKNIIITSNKNLVQNDCFFVHSKKEALEQAVLEKEIYIIGGENVYKQFIDDADKLIITRVHLKCDGDAFFPEINPKLWKMTEKIEHSADEKHKNSFSFETYEKIGD
mgnify:CR=1 FL=1